MVSVGDKIHICGYILHGEIVETQEGTVTKIDAKGNIYGTWGDKVLTVNDVFYGIQ